VSAHGDKASCNRATEGPRPSGPRSPGKRHERAPGVQSASGRRLLSPPEPHHKWQCNDGKTARPPSSATACAWFVAATSPQALLPIGRLFAKAATLECPVLDPPPQSSPD